ncbi:hypothetical protein GIB67_012910 [Kingdonia uniflora]|uniref:Uncharacterized protein n=1 Tax=Kingdonia uniflora TaxID=39325 RepID=A0A7J7NG35_9MAGN|nr:hypothetical protein GIB67_012910 [Kingdonia uniflora]
MAEKIGFTMPPKNKAHQEVAGDPSQDTPKHAKQLNETRTLHLPPEEWDALININENVSTFKKGGLLHEDLMESIFANRVANGRYATGPARDDFIDTATSDVTADLNLEDENNVPTDQADFIEDTDTYFTDHHFEPFQAEYSTPQIE